MLVWNSLFVVGIFAGACGVLCGLWLLVEHSGPQRQAKPHKKPPLSNWK